MSKCTYCGESAGIFSKLHKTCEQKHLEGIAETTQLLTSFFWGDKTTKNDVSKIAENSFISQSQLNEIFEKVFTEKLEKMLDDGLLDESEENQLDEFIEYFGLEQSVLNRNQSIDRLVGASILRNLFSGKKITGRVKIQGKLPFKFMQSEQLVYVYQNVLFSEQRIKTEYEGGSSGVSVKIAKGLYYRTSAFKGRPIKTTEMKTISIGLLALTDKHLYYSSSEKNFRVRYDSIITLKPYSDGIGIQKDGVTAKPMIFSEVDGWFCYNFIKNIENHLTIED